MESTLHAAGCPRTRVMIVDDDPLFRSLARAWVEEDARLTLVGEAQNGAEALVLLTGRDVDALLIDLEMPVMDGLAAATRAREIRPDLRIVMLTGAWVDPQQHARIRTVVDELHFKSEILPGSFGDALAVPTREMPYELHLVPQPSPHSPGRPSRPSTAPLLWLRILAGVLPPLLYVASTAFLGKTGAVACILLAAASIPLVAAIERVSNLSPLRRDWSRQAPHGTWPLTNSEGTAHDA